MQNPRLHHDPTRRFSNRVENYVKYRPGYPPAILTYLQSRYGLTSASIIADVGSGTGLLTKLFLDYGCWVYGIEPNAEMRQAAEQFLGDYPLFTSVAAAAEATTLPDASVDFITAGQAFHWFDFAPTQVEFRRILRPRGYIALIWNSRHPDSPFMQAYDQLVGQWAIQYDTLHHQSTREEGLAWFLSEQMEKATFANEVWHDWEGLRGRVLSSSYAPLPDHPNHAPLMAGLDELFNQYQQNGRVQFLYQTEMFIGR
ncbi:MAG: methyltransferase domain-containing protein [Anaerolineae bacterium]|nr:methyltransferase domain-containing protein [Anaerolineae bacterium]